MMEEAVCVKRADTIVSNIDVLANNLYEAECILNRLELLLCTKGTDNTPPLEHKPENVPQRLNIVCGASKTLLIKLRNILDCVGE